ncbi:hypothetical protein T4E_10154 [Trichinella pseudospiralis]|uniref:Uncharacterized protein n=1 Tax=Trichinella pseudospiralis TaxID=6337 RepID=A0A0V0YH13_TRIPS|nr:hypothetical protein T4E_10154 [Trichinella pseudospiralis]
MTFPNGIVGTFSPENSIAAVHCVTLSTVCPFLFVKRCMRAAKILQLQGWTADVDQVKVEGAEAFIVDPTLSANCYCPRMAGSERAVPILFSRLLKKFFSTAAASVDFYVTCVTHSGEAGSVLRGLKMASPVALLNKRSISVLLVLANCAPVRVVLFCLDVDDEVDGHNNLLYQLLSFIVKE